jgi:uncharacterized protein (TIGR02996 family)
MQTEVDAFLQRIRAYPDDDAPRLIFADWLEEQSASYFHSRDRHSSPPSLEWNEVRGRFIRIQIAIARLMEEEARERELTGLVRRDNTYYELVKQEQELEKAHRDEWIAPFHKLAAGQVFRRGFVEEANVEAREFLKHADLLFAAAPLRHIHLLSIGDDLQGVLQCPYLSRLSALTIHASYKREALARAVMKSEFFTGLKRLYLTRNRFEDDAAQHLAVSPVLSNLEELDLGDNELGETSALALASSPHLGSLRSLELRINRLGPVGAEAVAGSEKLTNLVRLGLSNNEIGNARLRTLSRTQGFFHVPALDLSENNLVAAGLQVILNSYAGPIDHKLIRLRNLDLGRNPLGDDGMRVLAACPLLENLQVLRLVDCRIGDEGVRVLAASPHLNNLVVLDLSNNLIGDPGCRVLLDPPHLRKLKLPITPLIGVSKNLRDALDIKYPDRLQYSYGV